MYRRVALLFLVMLVAFPFVAPATATEPSATPAAEPPVVPAPDGALDANGRFIVVLRDGTDTAAVVEKVRKRDGIKADRTFGKALRGFSAKLDQHQRRVLLADPNVLSIVPDEVIHLTAQQVPTGVSRVGGVLNGIAKIDGDDTRVDADVAIVDTGITAHPDLNIAGGRNCATSDPNAWRDKNHHGTHVAGTVAALDNDFGVVGVAPGARLWAVRILNDNGDGLISWYLCGLNWILAQRDPNDASRPLFEVANMSVTKAGSDDHNCGYTSKDLLHQAICRVVAGGITVVAAAANDAHNASRNIPASYNEVITVSALADTDGKPGGLGGNLCYSWGGYDQDDTFADFSNYGGDIDIIAPGKCILSTIPGPTYGYISGTSMSAPTVSGAVALYKESRPKATPAEVREALRYLGNLDWKVATDPDTTHEPLLDVSRIGPLGTFSLTPAGPGPTAEGGNTVLVPFSVVRSDTFFERVGFSITSLPAGWAASAASLMGWSANAAKVSVKIPPLTPPGTYTIGIRGTNQGRTADTSVAVDVIADDPTARPPQTSFVNGKRMGLRTTPIRVAWPPATDPTSAIGGYQLQRSVNGGAWAGTTSVPGTTHSLVTTVAFDTTYQYRMRAVDVGGHWSPWVVAATSRFHAYDDRSSRVVRTGTWSKVTSSKAYKQTLLGASRPTRKLTMTFTGHSIGVVAPRSLYRGKASVYIDGALAATISLRSSTSMTRRFVFSRYFPGGGTHTIRIVPTGTGRYPLIRIDAFVVGR